MDEEHLPKFQVSPQGWRLLGSAGLITAAVCLVGVVAVVALKRADALASIALVLAIAAFVVQIVVSALQNAASRSAEAKARELNFETNKVLEQIKSSAAANQQILAKQFDTLLNALIKAGKEVEKELKTENEEGGPGVSFDLPSFPQWTQGGPSDEDRKILETLHSFPDEEEAVPLLEKLTSLPIPAVAMLERYARDEARSRNLGGKPGLEGADSPLAISSRNHLMEGGLLQDNGDGYFSLTDDGIQVARLLKGRDEAPPNVAKALGIKE